MAGDLIGPRDKRVYNALVALLAEHGWPPSVRELSVVTGSVISGVKLSLDRLARHGYIVKGSGARMLRLTDKVMS